MREPDPTALFRLSVLGNLLARGKLDRGELKTTLTALAEKEYDAPGGERIRIAPKTLQAWYYAYQRDGLEGLAPKTRSDRGLSKIDVFVQERLLAAKRENPRRSLDTLLLMLETEGLVAPRTLSRSAIHRLLQRHGLSRPRGADSQPVERRSFEAAHANEIWYGDVMHGPRVRVKGRLRKTYLVSLMDDASRLIAHSAFCLSEAALDIEAVLKQAVLRRGVCLKLVVDNGAAYRSASLQRICKDLGIKLILCRPYTPEGYVASQFIGYRSSWSCGPAAGRMANLQSATQSCGLEASSGPIICTNRSVQFPILQQIAAELRHDFCAPAISFKFNKI